MEALKTTPGIAEARLPDAEVEKLLEPWFGPDVPVEALPVPRLIEVVRGRRQGFDAEGLRLRLAGRGARRGAGRPHPLAPAAGQAANRLRLLGLFSLLLIAAAGR
jgi:cell division transport system permease protein